MRSSFVTFIILGAVLGSHATPLMNVDPEIRSRNGPQAANQPKQSLVDGLLKREPLLNVDRDINPYNGEQGESKSKGSIVDGLLKRGPLLNIDSEVGSQNGRQAGSQSKDDVVGKFVDKLLKREPLLNVDPEAARTMAGKLTVNQRVILSTSCFKASVPMPHVQTLLHAPSAAACFRIDRALLADIDRRLADTGPFRVHAFPCFRLSTYPTPASRATFRFWERRAIVLEIHDRRFDHFPFCFPFITMLAR